MSVLRVLMIVLLAIGLAANDAAFMTFVPRTADAAQQSSAGIDEYSQCSNDQGTGYTTGDLGCRWTNGDLNHQNSTIYEGDATVQRLAIKGLETGDHTVTIEYQTTKQGKHAYDFLADDLYSESWVSAADLCQAPVATGLPSCASLTPVLSGLIPTDPSAGGFDTAQSARHFKIRNGTWVGTGFVGAPQIVSGDYTSDSLTQLQIKFHVDATTCADPTTSQGTTTCEVLITFGAHVSRQADWGAGTSAVNINGSPYHVKVVELDGSSIGNRDNQMAASAVLVATLTLVKTVTNDNGGTAVATDWTLTATGPQTISGATGSSAVTSVEIAPGTYALSESGPSGYTAGSWSCVKNNGAPVTGASITLANLDSATCAINNNDSAATLTLVKTVTNDNGGTAVATAWTLSATGPTTISGATGSASVTSASVPAGTYALAESGGPAGYTAGTWSCTGGTQNGSNITLALGQSATCTINNDDNLTHLTLVKLLTNDSGGTAVATDWTLSATGPTTISGATGSSAVTNATVTPGTYALSESGPSGYAAGTWSCTGGSQNGSDITLALGQSATCTITNDDSAATLTLVKTVTNDNGGTAVATAWTLSATGPQTISGASGAASVTSASVPAGTYALAESGGPAGYTAGSWSCVKNGGAPATGASITLANGDSATCTINNDDIAPHLTLAKHVINDNGGTQPASAWTLSALGNGFSFSGQGTPATGADASLGQDVDAGVEYTLGESGPTGYSAAAEWSCTGGGTFVSPDKITLGLAENVTCTMTNNDNPPPAATLTLIKTVTNDNGGTALATAWTLNASGPQTISGATGSAAVTNATVGTGTYTLSETGGPAGYTAGSWSCVKTESAPVTGASITLADGDNATCTINNNDVPPTPTPTPTPTPQSGSLIVVKYNDLNGNAARDAGEPTLSGVTFTLWANGLQIGTLVTDGAGSATRTGLGAGTYTLIETLQTGWFSTDPGGSAPSKGVVVAAGGTSTVLFGNQQVLIPPTTIGGVIQVTKYEDANRNKQRDAGESGLSGWEFAVRDAQGALVMTITTLANGTATASNLPPGTYTVTEFVKTGWVSTDPGGSAPAKSVTISAGQTVSVAFGNAKVQLPSTSTAGDPGNAMTLRIGLLALAVLCFALQWWMTRARRGLASTPAVPGKGGLR